MLANTCARSALMSMPSETGVSAFLNWFTSHQSMPFACTNAMSAVVGPKLACIRNRAAVAWLTGDGCGSGSVNGPGAGDGVGGGSVAGGDGGGGDGGVIVGGGVIGGIIGSDGGGAGGSTSVTV